MISRFFIDRPIFAAVLSIAITLAGGISMFYLALAQFPAVAPNTVTVTCNYPGASAMDVAEAVAAPIEAQVNGVEGMYYMASSCTNDGSYALAITFQQGMDLDMAQVMVQDRVSHAISSLPDVLKQTGVTVKKRTTDVLMGMAITSPNHRYDQLYLSNFALMQIRDELSRVEGVSDIFMLGQRDYSMRIWVDPTKLAMRGMTSGDVVRAIREQNMSVASGAVGAPPTDKGQAFQRTLSTLGRLSEAEQFDDIILKATHEGNITRIKDIGHAELGAKNQDVSVSFDGQPTVFLVVWQLPDANALATHDRILAKMNELSSTFPEGVAWDTSFDTTPYTRESIKEVFKTLADAVILVAAVVLVFLRNWRSALIPMIAVPVAIVGTFSAMAVLGFSLNTLTLFGLVLAIGIVVDDAIVVVEAVEHHIDEGLSPRDATIAAMSQVSGPVIAVGLVLSAVFVPCAFVSGLTGQFFRQFAVTIAVSTVISAFNSLTLSPALAALLLQPRDKHSDPPLPALGIALIGGIFSWWLLDKFAPTHAAWNSPWPYAAMTTGAILGFAVNRPLNRALAIAFAAFNRAFDSLGRSYAWFVKKMLSVSFVVLALYGGLLLLTKHEVDVTPKGFVPDQDMGYLLVGVQLPDAASLERTEAVLSQAGVIARKTPGVFHATEIAGQSFITQTFASNVGTMFINLKDYSQRRDPRQSAMAIVGALNMQFAKEIPEAIIGVFAPPPVRGAGRANGFSMWIENRGGLTPKDLQEQADLLVNAANQTGTLKVFPSMFRAKVPQLKVEPDIHECMEKGVSLREFSDALRVYQGSLYVNDFNLFGRSWQVIVQAEAPFRDQIEDIHRLRARNINGDMIPLGSLASVREINGPLVLNRYNMFSAAQIMGAGLPGVSSASAISALADVANSTLSTSMAYEWSDMSFLELQASDTAMTIFGFAVGAVFLVLAAQYESWSLPLAVILVVPMCLLSAVIGVQIAQLDINIFTRIGFVVLVGLASKNAILIVEFAKRKRDHGESRVQATVEACRLRLRPIVMTSLAFILGVVPLVLAQGAGAEMRKALGVAVFSGMIGVTLFGVFLTPVFFYAIDWIGSTRAMNSRAARALNRGSLDVLRFSPLLWIASHWRETPKPRKLPPEKAPTGETMEETTR